eukprot:2969674-Pyramimonas_sp.AAC.1
MRSQGPPTLGGRGVAVVVRNHLPYCFRGDSQPLCRRSSTGACAGSTAGNSRAVECTQLSIPTVSTLLLQSSVPKQMLPFLPCSLL